MESKILIIDDELQLRKLIGRIVSLEGFNVLEADNLKGAWEIIAHQPIDIVLCDVRLPDGNGVEFVKKVKTDYPSIEMILLTAFGNITDGVQAMKNGAFDYLVKGNDNDKIIPLLHQAMDLVQERQKKAIRFAEKPGQGFESILGETALIRRAVSLAQKIAKTESTVLLLGETGTGKEIFANAIHQNSRRNQKPFVAVNCSAFSKELLESELFGHKAGAFTGAAKDKKGLLELAEGGTLFLDEIGDLHIDLQAKLLRVLENGEYIKLGDSKISKADIRIIAATNRQLDKQMEKGHFREDLFYRLNVFSIELPSLRERREDIPSLVNHFLQKLADRDHRKLILPDHKAMNLLMDYGWKGNIRELKNVLERIFILSEGEEIHMEQLPYEIQNANGLKSAELSLASIEKKHIQKMLEYTKGNKAKAARLLEIGLATLYRKMEEYQIS